MTIDILIAEDNETNANIHRSVVESTMKKLGYSTNEYTITTAKDPVEAENYIFADKSQKRIFDLYLLDNNLAGGMNPRNTSYKIILDPLISEGKKPRAIFMTGDKIMLKDQFENDKREFYEDQTSTDGNTLPPIDNLENPLIISKPYHFELLEQAIGAYVGKKSLSTE